MASSSQKLRVAIAEGQTLAGKYLLVRQLGEGGMCIVYEAEHVGLQRGLALKILKPELANDRDCVARFEREARAAAQLRSPNVAKVFDVDYLPSGQPYITMELLVGQDIGGELHKSGRVPVPIAVDYVRQACSGIAEAHALGIVHRDLKPENLFLTELGELTDRKLVKILDFGIAKNIADSARRLTAPDAVFGTVDYMSPEQIRSASTVDHRTDLWSLGVILYEMLTGQTPYHGDARSVIAQIVSDAVPPPSTIVPDLPPSLVATVMRALEKDPTQRFQSAEELREALEGYGDFEPITAVIARLPPQSVPRRSAAASPSNPPGNERDARTHGSWETKSEPRTWGKTWLVVPAVAVVLGAAAGLAYWRDAPMPWATAAVAATAAVSAASASPLATPPAASLAPAASAPPSPEGTTSAPLAATTPTATALLSPTTAPGPAQSAPVASAKGAKPPGPRGPAFRAASPSPPPSATGAPRLPKHL